MYRVYPTVLGTDAAAAIVNAVCDWLIIRLRYAIAVTHITVAVVLSTVSWLLY